MSTRPPKKLTLKGKQTKEKVIKAGITCIARLGFHGASTNKIAEEAGVTWGTLQHQFGNKTKLLEEMISYAFAQQMRTVEEATDPDTPLQQRVNDMVEAFWHLQDTDTSIALNDLIRGVLSDSRLREQLLPKLHEVRSYHDNLWRRLYADSRLSDTELETAKQFTMATIRGLAADRSIRSSDEAIIAAKEQLKRWLISYLQHPQA